jgi:lysophospholipase L1-like esterase
MIKFKKMKISLLKQHVALSCLYALVFTLIACSKQAGHAFTPTITPRNDTTPAASAGPALKYLALGDSYTIGQSVAAEARFPAQTAQILKQAKINFSTIDYIATTGWTTNSLLAAINSQNPASNYDIVTLLIGVNDQYQQVDTTLYRIRFTQLLGKSVVLAGGRSARVFVLSIPDYSATPYVSVSDKARVRAEIDAFNAINKQVTLANNLAYLDITPSTRQASFDNSLIAGDGLHPSGTEYSKWATMLAPMIQKALQ